MRLRSLTAAFVFATISSTAMAADVGVSISIGQPGFYGRIDIGNYPYPRPELVYAEPRIIQRPVIVRDPIYMRVPPGHRNNWAKHCHKYDACAERVYFVKDSWYEREYVPHYQKQQRDRPDGRRGN